MDCAYLGEHVAGKEADGEPVHNCLIHGHCILAEEANPKIPSCGTCPDRLEYSNKEFAGKWVDPLVVTDRNRTPTKALRGMLMGAPTLLLCGGPSAKSLPLHDAMVRRGVFSMAVNNKAADGLVAPSAFVCADPPQKFSHCIWLDSTIMKFVPTQKLGRGRGRLRRKTRYDMENDPFIRLENRAGAKLGTKDTPNVWAFERRQWWMPDDTFFTDVQATWGNMDTGVRRTGMPKSVNTMLLAIRLLYYLGSRRIYLVGCDFRMTAEQGYAFPQARWPEAVTSNNRQFEVVGGMLCKMVEAGAFARFGLEVLNCYRESGLRAFPYAPFDAAVEDICQGIEPLPDTEGWYEK